MPDADKVGTHYDLLANICHEGKPEAGQGTYKVHVRHRGTEQWYQIQDLIVEEIMPQMIFLSESYIQVTYKRREGVGTTIYSQTDTWLFLIDLGTKTRTTIKAKKLSDSKETAFQGTIIGGGINVEEMAKE